MDANYLKASRSLRCEEILRLIQILRQTLERRFRHDEVVDAAVDNIWVEVELLRNDIRSN